MAEYRRGAKGAEVTRIQERLKALGHYQGPVDGDFGGGTEAAVRVFQRAGNLTADGVVGDGTWGALFPGEAMPRPAIVGRPIAFRALALTGAFETSAPVPECFAGVCGDFDGQGMSFGALQWNLGQNTLQPLLRAMDQAHPAVMDEIFGDHCAELRAVLAAGRDDQLAWVRTIQNPRFVLIEPWRGCFKTLGRRPEFQDVQVGGADRYYQTALGWCREFGVQTERAAALLFDIAVQNGSINDVVRRQIERDTAQLAPSGDALAAEVARLRIIANRRAEAAAPRWIEDVRTRKLTIAEGRGTVHGNHYDLEGQYGIRLTALGG